MLAFVINVPPILKSFPNSITGSCVHSFRRFCATHMGHTNYKCLQGSRWSNLVDGVPNLLYIRAHYLLLLTISCLLPAYYLLTTYWLLTTYYTHPSSHPDTSHNHWPPLRCPTRPDQNMILLTTYYVLLLTPYYLRPHPNMILLTTTTY